MKPRHLMLVVFLSVLSGLVLGRSSGSLPIASAAHTPAASPYARFLGSWFHHGGSLTIGRNGHGFYSYRTYVFCTAHLTTTCDKETKNVIYDGGFSRFTLHRTVGNKAYGSMDNSAYSWQVGTTVTLVAKPNDTLVLYEAGAAPTTVCGSKAPAGFCGA
jgi:hypothetical protein